MHFILDFYRSTVGKKVLMALTGLAMFGFVLGHMAGNLKIFLGANALGIYKLDHYAEMLRMIGADFLGERTFLWMVRAFLIVCVSIHSITATQLYFLNRKAKGVGYERSAWLSSTISSRTMIYGGVFLGLFVVFHILHFTTGNLNFDGFESGQVYSNVFHAFQHGYLVLVYVLSMLALALHIYHGGWSLFQTLGMDTPVINPALRIFAKVAAVLLFLGFVSAPVSVYFGVVPAPNQVALSAGK